MALGLSCGGGSAQADRGAVEVADPVVAAGVHDRDRDRDRLAAPDPIAPRASAALQGDANAQERAILGLDNAELPEDVLLALPGSAGLAPDGAAAASVPDGGRSLGTPQTGSLRAAVQLPLRPDLYTRRDPGRSFGSTHTIRTIHTALTSLRRERGVDAEVIIGDLSLPRGGPFAPHVSHQSGRDIDIRLVLAVGIPRDTMPRAPEHVDWDATWALVHSFVETGQVTSVFLGFDRQPFLHGAAERAGVHPRVLDAWFQWPDPGGPGLIRHEDGHLAHVHIRLACGPADVQCTGA